MSDASHRATPLRAGLATALIVGVGVIVSAMPASAAVKPVLGSGYGYRASISFFGSPTPMVQKPTPKVKLPKGGSSTPVTKTAASGSIVFGPATILTTGPIELSTVGSAGSASTSAALKSVVAGPFSADSVMSSCMASNGGAAQGSDTVINGVVVTSTDAMGNPTSTMAVPTNPGVGLDIPGTVQISASDTESFDWIFNEQIHNTNGSLTVNAAHEIFHGPTAVGDLFIGESLCRS